MDKIKIVIADDHQILIDGLVSFFHETGRIEVIGQANDGATLLRELYESRPDIVLLDLNMPKLDGISTLERLKKDHPKIRVIILSNYNQSRLVEEARNKGADAYLLKNGSKYELLEAIDAVMKGEGSFAVGNTDISHSDNKVFTDEFLKKFQLTKREVEIIRMVCCELNSREIGEKLFISEFTVNTHRRNILAKLNVKNIAGLINFAQQQGIWLP